jgi:alpha-tubulin suppressor-like RCC1 family protein
MRSILSNAATAKLVSAINSTTTTLSITVGAGSKFPTTTVDNVFNVVLQDASTNIEICEVTERAGDVLTVVRGQEGTVARAFAVGDAVAVRMTAKAFNDKVDITTVQSLISAAIATLTATVNIALGVKADAVATASAIAAKIDTTVANAAIALKANLTGATFTGAINTPLATIVATASTTPIWAGNSGNSQIWSGTPTIVIFPDAPQPGASRTVYPALGTLLKNNANINVQGNADALAEAGDVWVITAKATNVVDVLVFKKSGLSLTTPPREDVRVKGFSKNVKAPQLYQQFSILMDNNKIKTWGRADNQALGTLESANAAFMPSNPVFLPAVPSGVEVKTYISTGANMFVVLTNGWVYSCGLNTYGMLGHGDVLSRAALTRIEFFVINNIVVADVFADASRLTNAAGQAFFTNAAGNVWACGNNALGQLGVGNTTQQNTPTPISGAFTGITRVVIGGDEATHVILHKSDGTIYATGTNNTGQLGTGDLVNRSAFTAMIGGTNVAQVEVTAGYNGPAATAHGGSTIVLKNDKTVFTCGYNGSGQLGLGDTTNRSTLTQVSSLTNIDKVDIVGGFYGYAYAISATKRLFTWGYNAQGQVGNGTLINQSTPYDVNTHTANTAQDPPFIGKIVQVEPSFSQFGYCFLTVLDSDGKLWFAGYDYMLFASPSAIARPRFTGFNSVSLEKALEKIVSVRASGYDALYRLFAISDTDNLYAIGENSYGACSGINNASSSNLIKSFQPVRLV